jgi:hypothetical protein
VTQPTIASEIERYLRTGDADMMGFPWPGDLPERGRRQHVDIRGALLEEVRRLAKGRTHEAVPENVGAPFTRAKVEPMVRGFFPKAEQDVVLATLEKSVVYVTSETIEPIILNHGWDRSAWDLANLYLLSVGAELLGPDAPRVVGISEETNCYVSPDYFAEDDPFADFVVHEAAHIFHNCKRRTIGLRETRTKEWLRAPARAASRHARRAKRPEFWGETAKPPLDRSLGASVYRPSPLVGDEREMAQELSASRRQMKRASH